jgi:hypothetical protein
MLAISLLEVLFQPVVRLAIDRLLGRCHAPPARLCFGLVELRGIEPLTSAVRLQRSPI